MKFLPEARVARLAGCRLKQKAGYGQHASPYKLHAITKATFMMQPYLSLEFPMHMFASKLKE